MSVITGLDEIGEATGILKKKTADLFKSGVLLGIITGKNRMFYYTTDGLINYTKKHIEYFTKKEYLNIKDVFSEKNLTNDIFKNSTPCEVITVTNQKGGIGKTTFSANISATLALLGKKVLLVDVDSQGHSSSYFKKKLFKDQSIMKLFEQFNNGKTTFAKDEVREYICKMELNDCTIDVLPSELRLGRAIETLRSATMSHLALTNILSAIKEDYDYIIIDTPPGVGLALQVSLYATDKVVVVTDGEDFSLDGVEVSLEEIQAFSQLTQKDIIIDAFIITRVEQIPAHEKAIETLMDYMIDLGLEQDKLLIMNKSRIVNNSQMLSIPFIEFTEKPRTTLQYCEPLLAYCCNKILEKLK